MRTENIAEVSRIVEEVKKNGFPSFSASFSLTSQKNHVMDPKYGQTYIVPIPEDYINIFNQYNNLSDSKYDHVMDDIFQDIVIKNPDLRRFQNVPQRRRFDVVMGAASWLLPRDIQYYLQYSYSQRPRWVNELSEIAVTAYGDRKKVNKRGFIEWVAFIYSPETALAIIEDNSENLREGDILRLSQIAEEHPGVIPFRLHALINN